MAKGKVTGFSETKAGIRKGGRRFERAAGLALHDLGEVIFDKSQEDVPMQPLRIRESLGGGEALIETAVLAPFTTKDALGSFVSYDADYAVKIEVDSSFDAKRQERLARVSEAGYYPDGAVGGKSRFLTDAFTKVASKAFGELGAGTKTAFDSDDRRARMVKRGKRRKEA